MATSVKYSGWKRTRGQTYISAFNLGIEGLRITKSATGCHLRLLGDTPGTNYILFDASAPSLAIGGSIAVTIGSTLGVTGILTAGGGITMADAKNIVLNTTTGTKIGTATTQKLGFYNAAPVVQPSAYTQTYATADKTHAADGSTDVATADLVDDGGAYNAAWCDTVVTICNEIKADFNYLRATVTDLKQLANSIVDDLQTLGLAA